MQQNVLTKLQMSIEYDNVCSQNKLKLFYVHNRDLYFWNEYNFFSSENVTSFYEHHLTYKKERKQWVF